MLPDRLLESFGVRSPGKPGFEQRGVGLHAGARKPGGPKETISGPKKQSDQLEDAGPGRISPVPANNLCHPDLLCSN